MGKKSRRDALKLEEEAAALAASKAAEAKAIKRAATTKSAFAVAPPADSASQDSVAEPVTEPVQKRIAEPVAEKPKKVRFVREKIAKKAPLKDTMLPPRNTTVAGKLMSKNVTLRLKEEPSSGPKDDRVTGPKPKSKR